MNAEERREARRRRILENSENRLKKITTISTSDNVLNGLTNYMKDEQDTSTQIPGWTVPTCHTENVTSTIIEDQHFLNYEPNHLDPLIHSKKTKNYEIQFSYITILHFVLSQIVLVLFYFNLGFLFGNSIVLPFLLSMFPELYSSERQHDGIHMFVLLMLGLSQDRAKQISRCAKLTSVIGKRFCIYIFCFTCSYAVCKNFNTKHNSSFT